MPPKQLSFRLGERRLSVGISCQFSHPKKSLTSFYWIRSGLVAITLFTQKPTFLQVSPKESHSTPLKLQCRSRDPFAHFSKVKWIIIHPSTDSRAEKRSPWFNFQKSFSLSSTRGVKLPIHYLVKRQMQFYPLRDNVLNNLEIPQLFSEFLLVL